MTKLILIPGLILALLLGACGGDDDSDGNSSNDNGSTPAATQPANGSDGGDDDDDGGSDNDFHACSLFTGAELSEILGVEVSDGRDYLAVAADATNCTWEGGSVIFIEVLLDDGQAWYDAIHFADGDPGDEEEIDGLGDVAQWDSFLNSLDVVVDDRFFSVQPIGDFGDKTDRQVAIEVAEAVIERLP